jgi:hypothetical protein
MCMCMWLRLRLRLRVDMSVMVEVGVHARRWLMRMLIRLLEVRLVVRHDGARVGRR